MIRTVNDNLVPTRRRGTTGRPRLGRKIRKAIAFRIDADLLVALRREAKRRGLGYQTLIHAILTDHARAAVKL